MVRPTRKSRKVSAYKPAKKALNPMRVFVENPETGKVRYLVCLRPEVSAEAVTIFFKDVDGLICSKRFPRPWRLRGEEEMAPPPPAPAPVPERRLIVLPGESHAPEAAPAPVATTTVGWTQSDVDGLQLTRKQSGLPPLTPAQLEFVMASRLPPAPALTGPLTETVNEGEMNVMDPSNWRMPPEKLTVAIVNDAFVRSEARRREQQVKHKSELMARAERVGAGVLVEGGYSQ